MSDKEQCPFCETMPGNVTWCTQENYSKACDGHKDDDRLRSMCLGEPPTGWFGHVRFKARDHA